MAAMSCRASSVSAAVAEWLDPITDLEVVSAEQIQQWIDELEWMLSRWLDDTAGSSFKEEEVTEEQSIPFAELPLDAEGLLSFPCFVHYWNNDCLPQERRSPLITTPIPIP
ncbi:hypothetical protein MT997_06375 [Paenibacillus sp. OVF10]|nr:hypothetical protein MT997_06375 [Paenibacillus sp. OVF10]